MQAKRETMSYFDLDAILADEELIPAVFLTDVVGLGCLNASSVDDDIPAETRLELPLWLGRDLAVRNVSALGTVLLFSAFRARAQGSRAVTQLTLLCML